MNTIQVKMQNTRDTKGTYFYQELNGDGQLIHDQREGRIGTMYIRKSSFPNGAPRVIVVTIDADESVSVS